VNSPLAGPQINMDLIKILLTFTAQERIIVSESEGNEMKKYIVMNNTTDTTVIFTDIVKARNAVVELSTTTSHFWYLKIQP